MQNQAELNMPVRLFFLDHPINILNRKEFRVIPGVIKKYTHCNCAIKNYLKKFGEMKKINSSL